MSTEHKLQQLIAKCKDDFEFFAINFLKIIPKGGGSSPFTLNKAQRIIHNKLEEQLKTTGRVRAVILKARQQGVSTYIAARFFHKIVFSRGLKGYLLAHQSKSTDNIYGMVDRFYKNLPGFIKPELGKCNDLEFTFKKLDSGYALGTAGSKEQGRGETVQFLHSSETAFYDHPEIAAGLFQAIPDSNGTEMIYESTANGMGNMFHGIYNTASKGENSFIAIFTPWFKSPEYVRKAPEDFQCTPDELIIKELYDLSNDQIFWRRYKIQEFTDAGFPEGIRKFRQEYPANDAEAFQGDIENAFISSDLVNKARENDVHSPQAAKIVGVDVARAGNAKTAIVLRQGRTVLSAITLKIPDTMQLVAYLVNFINKEMPDKVFVDAGGVGGGVYDRLKELGFKKLVSGIDFGSRPFQPDRFKNKRTEMWCAIKSWLEDGDVSLPNNNELHADLTIPKCKVNSMSQYQLESKDDIRRRGFASPDLGDALALTFAMPVASPGIFKSLRDNEKPYQVNRSSTGWMSN